MAYMNQQKKQKIAQALKAVVPQGWKYSLAVQHHSGIAMTIRKAPVNLLRVFSESEHYKHETAKAYDVNPYWYHTRIEDPEMLATFERIIDALNLDNHNRSDLMTDYHDVGHYVSLTIGSWDKPFQMEAK